MITATLEEARTPSVAIAGRGWRGTSVEALAWLVCIGLTMAAYGSSLQAGIMFDAALDLPRATQRSWLELLTSAGASPYFRPVTLVLWKACYQLLGHNNFTVLHGLSLASHIVCGWLVYQLGRRLIGEAAGLLAATLFVLFPLSYQVVAFVDSLFHSLAALWLLAAAVLYFDARRLASRRRMIGALVCGALTLLTHEGTAVLLLPTIIGMELFAKRAAPKPQGSRWPAAFAVELAAFVALWLAVPRWPTNPHLDLPSLQLNTIYFLQATAYPVTMLLGHLPRWGGGDATEVLLLTAAVLAALLGISAVRGRLRVALYGCAWFSAAVIVPALLLPWPNYVIDAPRLLYGASAGIALLWAAALAPSRLGLSILPAVLLLIALAESWSFLAIRERFLDQGAAVVRQLLATADQGGRVYVNLPAFFGPKDPDFLLGHSGVTMLPDYFGIDLEVAAASGKRLPVESLAYDDLASPWTDAYGFQGRRATPAQAAPTVAKGGGVYVTRYAPSAVSLDYVGRVDPARGPSSTLLARFGNWAAVEQARVTVQGDTLAVHLVWRTLAKAPGDYTAFIHVVGDGSVPLVQSDGYPIAGLLPPRDWPVGAVVDDERRIPLPPQAGERPLRVLVGLYDRASPTTRARAVNVDGIPLPDDALSVDVVR